MACPKVNTVSQEFQPYGFRDFLRATSIAPLACIPAAVLVNLLILFPSNRVVSFPQAGFARFTSGMYFLLYFLLPTAYITTTLFGVVGLSVANLERIRPTIPIGAVAGIICGAMTGFLWTLILTGDNFSLSIFVEGFIGAIITPISILSGLFIGMVFVILMNRRFQW